MIRIFDIIASIIAIVILLPFMIPIMIGLKLTGEHDIFYLQPRIGRGGKEFKVIKFATMLKNSPSLAGGFITLKNDPRILPMGNFLRKTKINELPQLFNILLGQMSLVGPRPIVGSHMKLYPELTRDAILAQVPGLTGIGSLVFRDEERMLDLAEGERKRIHDEVFAPYKGELEVWYSQHRGLGTYFLLILLTAWALVRPETPSYKNFFRDLPSPSVELQKYLDRT